MKVLPGKSESLPAYFTFYVIFGRISLASPIFNESDEDRCLKITSVHRVNGFGVGVDSNPVQYLVFCKSLTVSQEHIFVTFLDSRGILRHKNKVRKRFGR